MKRTARLAVLLAVLACSTLLLLACATPPASTRRAGAPTESHTAHVTAEGDAGAASYEPEAASYAPAAATAPSTDTSEDEDVQGGPREPPSYNVHANPHASRPTNTLPLAPDAPSVAPVKATSRPPSASSATDKDHSPPQPASGRPAEEDVVPQQTGPQPNTPPNPKKGKHQQQQQVAGRTPPDNSIDSDNDGIPDDDDDEILSDDPKSLPIPSRMSSSSGFPEPHDPLIHVTPPPSGGWRAGQLRQRAEVEKAKRKREEAIATGKLAPAADQAAEGENGASSDDDEDISSSSDPTEIRRGSNSYISPHGPSPAFQRNASRWFDPPALHGPVPYVADPANYKPGGAPEYWMPDSVHMQMLEEQHRVLHAKHAARKGSYAARTTRLAALDPSTKVVDVRNNMLFVEGQPFWIQGICYSPVPIGESVSFSPKGDYFTPDFAYIWQRDLPLIKAMGATTLRIYGWAADADHTMFLDAVQAAGLKVLVTYYLGDAEQHPVSTQDQRNQLIIDFVAQVNRYRDHPAILMWSFGNELNGAWNGFAKQFSDSFTCWWQAGCAGYSDTNSDCHWQSSCMYYQLFSWINAACRAAKMVTTRPIISGFADVDYMVGPTPWLDKVARFNYLLPDMDAWAVQLYRGYTFGGYFGMYRGESQKPMLVTEFGVDAYNDACGWPERNQGGCFNMVGEAAGGADDNGHFWGCAGGGECAKPGVIAQSEWDVRLAQELMNQYVDRGGIVWGGFLMAWTDEFWKGGGTQDLCAYPCKTWDADYCRGPGIQLYKPGGGAMCSWRAHFTCPNFDTNYHDLCGYFLSAAPDNYVNEEWFGITSPLSCGLHKVNPDGVDGGYRLDSLYVRPAYINMMQLWTGQGEVDTSHVSCAALRPCWACAVSHSIEELNDGSCELECEVHHLATGPGSSVQAQKEREGLSLLSGESHQTGFLLQFGLPLAIAAVILIAATTASILVWKRHSRRQEAAGEPLLR